MPARRRSSIRRSDPLRARIDPAPGGALRLAAVRSSMPSACARSTGALAAALPGVDLHYARQAAAAAVGGRSLAGTGALLRSRDQRRGRTGAPPRGQAASAAFTPTRSSARATSARRWRSACACSWSTIRTSCASSSSSGTRAALLIRVAFRGATRCAICRGNSAASRRRSPSLSRARRAAAHQGRGPVVPRRLAGGRCRPCTSQAIEVCRELMAGAQRPRAGARRPRHRRRVSGRLSAEPRCPSRSSAHPSARALSKSLGRRCASSPSRAAISRRRRPWRSPRSWGARLRDGRWWYYLDDGAVRQLQRADVRSRDLSAGSAWRAAGPTYPLGARRPDLRRHRRDRRTNRAAAARARAISIVGRSMGAYTWASRLGIQFLSPRHRAGARPRPAVARTGGRTMNRR